MNKVQAYKINQEDEDNIERFKTMFYVILVILTFNIFFSPIVVNGYSMENTLKNNQPLMIYKIVTNCEYNDIIVVYAGHNIPGSTYIIKRVLAVSGDLVEIHDGKFFRNEEEIFEPYIKEPMETEGFMPAYIIPEGEIFLMGDNRNESGDSREYGTFSQKDIVGKIICN
ncbi:MAG: signal peptidase I [Proteocatella sp.]